jgi:3-oxoadipate enol-lactonase
VVAAPTGASPRPGPGRARIARPPGLPEGRRVPLPDGTTTFVRTVPAPPGRPTVLLLHGLGVTADANWFTAFPALGREVGVVAIDHRGHGRGAPVRGRFRLAQCADDAVAVLDALEVEQAVAVGYSMGGPIAQLAWRRHRDRVAGLVLCATAHRFRGIEPVRDLGPAVLRRIRRTGPRTGTGSSRTVARHSPRLDPDLRRWLIRELGRTPWWVAAQAGFALSGHDAARWIGDVDVPHAVVLTERDNAVSPARQRRMAAALPSATVHPAAVDHAGCITRPHRFVPALLDAVRAASP